ncbi:MAG: hypothetical protein KJZ62_04530, partial [Fimbriimonadaceae bacterium]|nr:hypothetical protein [Fimbriimonadaceae bacterium]
MRGRARKGVFGRLVSIALVFSLAYSSGSAGINGALLAAADFAQRALQSGRVPGRGVVGAIRLFHDI